MNVTVPRGRLVALLVAMAVAFAGLVWRLADVQGVSAERYAVFGESQRLESRVLPADRGSILDRNGAELAISLRRQTVWADPTLVTDPPAAAFALAPVLGLDENELSALLTEDSEFVYLARTVEDDVATAVRALDLDGVFLLEEPKRFLPSGTLAAPVLGEVGSDDVGLSGLELQYDELLTGHARRATGGEGHRRQRHRRRHPPAAAAADGATTSSSPSTRPCSTRPSGSWPSRSWRPRPRAASPS